MPKVIALSMVHDADTVDAMIQAGAQGYVLKAARAAELMAAIRTVAAGGAAIDPSVAAQVLEHYRRMASGDASQPLGEFSERELSLLRLLAEGESNHSVAARLHLSQQTQ